METSNTHSKHSRPVFARFGKIVSAAAFAAAIGAFAIGTARADEHRGGGDHGRGHAEHHEDHGRGYHRGPDVVYGNPDYYYAPAPGYYNEPDPYDYRYYPTEPGYNPPAPSDGINLFFGR